MAASYQFYLDSFKVTRNGSLIFVDEFNDGTPPAECAQLFRWGNDNVAQPDGDDLRRGEWEIAVGWRELD